MKLSQYKEKNKSKKVIIILIAIVLLIGGIIIGSSFASFKENKSFKVMEGNFIYEGSGDIIFAFYNGDKSLTKMPLKDNEENLAFEKAICDNGASVEWNEEKWAPLVINLTTSKTKCDLYFVEMKEIQLDKDIPLATNNQTGLYAVEHNNLTTLDNSWNKTEYRYAGSNPNNYVSFNNEIWRIIGLVNVKTTTGVEQRVKIIRTNKISNQKDFGFFAWDRSTNHTNNWTTSKLKDMLNGIYYNSGSGECYTGSYGSVASQSVCDFSGNGSLPKGLNEEARNMLDKDVIWNIGGIQNPINTLNVTNWYEYERGTTTYDTYPNVWTKDNDAVYHNGIGLMYMSDYGYATDGGMTTREKCLNDVLSNYSTDIYNRCGSSGDWLMPRNASWPLAPSISFSNNVYPVDTDIAVYYYQSSYVYSVTPVVYLNTSTKIYSLNSDGSLNNPFKLKNIT